MSDDDIREMHDINVRPTPHRRGWWVLLLMSIDALFRLSP